MKNKINYYKIILRIAFGSVFIFSAYTKLISPGIVEVTLIEQGLFVYRDAAAVFVRLLIGIEFSLGILYILNCELKRIVIPSSLIFLIASTLYLFYTGYILKDMDNCGCFGDVIPMSPLESIIKNIILLALIFYFIKLNPDNKNNILVVFFTVFLTISLVFIVLPLKSYEDFKFGDITSFVGKGRVDLTEGEKFIVILNTECEHCQELAKELSSLKSNQAISSKIFALLFSEGNISVDSFKLLTKFDYPYYRIDIDKFFDLIGTSPPRIYWLKDGIVKEYWDNNFVKNILRTQYDSGKLHQ